MKKKYCIEDILSGCQKKQAIYQRALVDQFSGYLHATCKRYMNDDGYAKDLVQESLIKIFKNIDKYDPAKGSFQTWITTITVRSCLSKLKKKKIATLSIDHPASETVSTNRQLAIDQLQTKYLIEMIKELPDGFREVFNLAVIDGYSHSEIAKQLNITEENSRSRLTRARRTLRKKINNLTNQELWVNSI